jgi:nitroreductase
MTFVNNPVIQTMLSRASIRSYTDQIPTDDIIETIVRAGQQAPFASQLYSVLLKRQKENTPYKAPLLFTICVDMHKLERFMAKRNWQIVTNHLFLLILGIQDATLMAENMVLAAQSLGLGSCFIGDTPYRSNKIAAEYKLPKGVFPLVQLVMGYPAQSPPPRPRFPLEFVLFEDQYPDFDDDQIKSAMSVMDEGYLAQDYYRQLNAMIQLEGDQPETYSYETYSWTEHISRKWGQWLPSLVKLLSEFEARGFLLMARDPESGS